MTHTANNPVSSNDIAFFADAGIEMMHAETKLDARYNMDMFDKYSGDSQVVLFPKTTKQVSEILAYCNEHRISVVTQGGNSGVAGGAIAHHGEIILSLRDMNKVRELDPVAGVLVADSGCVLEDLDNYVQEHGFIMPVDLGGRKRCMIGGNVSTSAGGLRYLRYGSMHGNVLGLEVVLPDGRILDALFSLKKDASGYDVKQLFIGAEGTLGVVTAVSISLAPKPSSAQIAVLGLNEFTKIHRAFVLARQHLGEIVSAFEFWEKRCNEIVVEYEKYTSPIGPAHEFYVMIETRGSCKKHDAEKMDWFLEKVQAEQIADEVKVFRDQEEMEAVWLFRSQMASAHTKSGCMYVYDFSLPPKHQYDLLLATKKHMESLGLFGAKDSPVKDITLFGHVGDQNLHLQAVAREFGGDVEAALEPWIYQWVGSHGGSVAAEHGLGAHKGKFLQYSKSHVVVDTMKQIKNLLDPRGIMNPGKCVDRA
ncbi:D-lactate ferricytochrome c oxidoreductase [Coemansia brasiliensis]|uniref:D-lactate ferricytochrome c oxidoreductase n=1 Tax=Coemansia brasiliensis TaxID=2650707 RepID=A0A9W8IB80_9FUNG|nr:D-lactate ferricytochrome c oxidoreductase [Coemansia brasiliensis]